MVQRTAYEMYWIKKRKSASNKAVEKCSGSDTIDMNV